MTTYLYVGTRKGLDKWIYDHDLNPSDHGKSVKWANNGPNHLYAEDAPVKIIDEDEWYEKTIWDELSITRARTINSLATQRKQVTT